MEAEHGQAPARTKSELTNSTICSIPSTRNRPGICPPLDQPSGLWRGCFLCERQMPSEPETKCAVAFLDGQDLFYAAKEAFGYPYPNYDPELLTERICAAQGWDVAGINFYTGIPSTADKPFWNQKTRSINGTDWIRVDRATYDACIDPKDYRPKRATHDEGPQRGVGNQEQH
jgi:hypothetical protein